MKPTCTTIGDCELWLGDFREVMPAIVRAHAVITDPPYGIPKSAAFVRTNCTRVDDGDEPHNTLRDDAWLGMLDFLVEGGNVAYFHARGDEPVSPKVKPWHRFYWVKPSVPPTPRQVFASSVEECTIAQVAGRRRWFGGGWTQNYWIGLSPNRLECDHGHPSEKPVELMRILVESLADVGEIVVDPFMGSGTTGVACVLSSRKFIGCEIEPKYHAIACERITEAYEQRALFEPVPKPVQMELCE